MNWWPREERSMEDSFSVMCQMRYQIWGVCARSFSTPAPLCCVLCVCVQCVMCMCAVCMRVYACVCVCAHACLCVHACVVCMRESMHL